ncbi:MAG: DUF4258 domain-containing protein [Phycisphaerae bacterium]|nr:DUF4258 domain-containing protein [Phycisphaerae bacterium]
MGSRIGELRRKVALGQYELTAHAKDEMEQDGFTIWDVKSAVYGGKIIRTQRHGTGRRKHVVSGPAKDGRRIRLICRLTEIGCLRIITVFEE